MHFGLKMLNFLATDHVDLMSFAQVKSVHTRLKGTPELAKFKVSWMNTLTPVFHNENKSLSSDPQVCLLPNMWDRKSYSGVIGLGGLGG